MYKHILIATDGSELANKAVAQGLDLAKALGAKATVVTVTEPWTAGAYETIPTPSLIDAYERAVTDSAALILAAVGDAARKREVACNTIHVANRYAVEGILDAAKDKDCDLIVMASHGRRGVARLLLGSETMKVLTLGTVPVLVIR